MPTDGVRSMNGPIYGPEKFTLTNAQQTLTELGVDIGSGQLAASAVIVTCETNDARWGTTQIIAADAAGHVLKADDSLRLVGFENVRNLRLCNAAAGSNAVVQISVEGP